MKAKDKGHPVFGVVGYHECKYVSKKSPPEIFREDFLNYHLVELFS
jgi:hypothetical protein